MRITTKSIGRDRGNHESLSHVSLAWRAAQYVLMLAGFVLVVTLVLRPETGLDAFWNMLIPVAPALVVIAPKVKSDRM